MDGLRLRILLLREEPVGVVAPQEAPQVTDARIVRIARVAVGIGDQPQPVTAQNIGGNFAHGDAAHNIGNVV